MDTIPQVFVRAKLLLLGTHMLSTYLKVRNIIGRRIIFLLTIEIVGKARTAYILFGHIKLYR